MADAFAMPIGPKERQLLPNLWGLEIDPEREAEAYIGQVKENLREVVSPAFFHEIERQVEHCIGLARRRGGGLV